MAKTKECAGLPKLGIARHVARLDAFGKSSNAKDGLTRVCRACDHADANAWRDARKAATASPISVTEPIAATDDTEAVERARREAPNARQRERRARAASSQVTA